MYTLSVLSVYYGMTVGHVKSVLDILDSRGSLGFKGIFCGNNPLFLAISISLKYFSLEYFSIIKLFGGLGQSAVRFYLITSGKSSHLWSMYTVR